MKSFSISMFGDIIVKLKKITKQSVALMVLSISSAGLLMTPASVTAAEGSTAGVAIGYLNDGNGVFPADCRPTHEWQEFGTKPPSQLNLPPAAKDVGLKPPPHDVPDATKPVMKNIVWRTTMPSMSESTPIVVGKKVFTMSEPGWPPVEGDAPLLVCVDGDTGKILWKKPVDQFDALPADKQAEARKLRADFWAARRHLAKLMLAYNDAINAGDKAAIEKLKAEIQADKNNPFRNIAADKLLATQKVFGWPPGGSFTNSLKKWNFTHPLWNFGTVGQTYASPASDGERLYVTTGYGAVAAFDLDGNRQWLYWIFDPIHKRPEMSHEPLFSINVFHAAAPVVVTDTVIVRQRGYVIGLDKKTGAMKYELRQKDAVHPKYLVDTVATAAVLDFNGEKIVLQPRGYAHRASDGKLVADPAAVEMRGMDQCMYAVDPVTKTVFFSAGGHSGHRKWGDVSIEPGSYAVRLTMTDGKLVGKVHWHKTDKIGGNMTAVYWRGKVYGGDTVLNAETGEKVGSYKIGNAGQGVVIAGGRLWGGIAHDNLRVLNAPIAADGTVGASVVNLLGRHDDWDDDEKAAMQSYGMDRIGTWYNWAIGRGYPVFSGNRVFYRTFGHLYCIGNKDEPFKPAASSTPAQ